ncbi:Ig-like domain-containing protein [Nocardioides conyzicola]|uniref:Bacterial Ig-like domain-containing protein n=1 Tax=Nocardioides conyzicola TaxID=1651781 RepID=A0ABP8XA89_9ACTN
MRSPLRALRHAAVVSTSAGLVVSGLLFTAPTATADPGLASGPDWSISAVPAGLQVTLELDDPLPMVDDAPTLLVDGVSYGVATESADGTTLSVITSDRSVLGADDVELGWSSGSASQSTPTDSPVTAKAPKPLKAMSRSAAKALLDDPSAAGTYSYTEDDYDFGDAAIPMAGIGGIRGEMTGRVYLPTTGGARPTVILLHGRHSSCSGGSWPCAAGRFEIPSYKGYDALGQNLATHGYAVVSISANAINANDAGLTLDNGALARGQLVIDSLKMLKQANAGEPVSYHDAALNQDLTLDQALASTTADASGSVPTGTLTAADLVGRFDLSDVGLMGHSRGGEGVVSAVTLNQALAEPFGIKSVLPLAPVDFGRMTVKDIPMLVMLPYCDGDVSNQQGQHFSDDSRYAFGDSVLRSTVWVMGADHNFFNTTWTPGAYPYATSDDWSPTGTSTKSDTVCSTAVAGNQRLSAADQYATGAAVMAAWFRLTLGGENALLPMFDGTTKPTLPSVPAADLRTIATAPAGARADINRFVTDGPAVTAIGSSTVGVCASAAGRTLPQSLPACATASTVRSTSAMPHWTPANFAPNVPASPMTRYTWTATSGTSASRITVRVPAAARNASAYQALTFNTAPDEAVVTGTDLTITVVDSAGATWSTLASAVNPLAVNRMPISGSTTLNKIVLQQVSIPVSSMTGINTADIREVRFAGANGADATATGGVYLTDLAFTNSSIGTPVVVGSSPTINVDPTSVEEGDTADTKSIAVYLTKPVDKTVSGYLTVIGSTASTGKAGLVGAKVTFAPGQTCQAVTVPTYGDITAPGTLLTNFKAAVSNPQGVITGSNAFNNLTVRDDDRGSGATPVTLAPAVGAQGDVCAEYAAKSVVGELATTDAEPAPGDKVTLTGTGFRSGESVAFTSGGSTLGSVIADASGTATFVEELAKDAVLGAFPVKAVGAGSGRTEKVDLSVLAPTETSLALSPETPGIKDPVTLTATVSGADTNGTVEFFDGETSLGSADVVEGVASLEVPAGFLAGPHSLTAVFGKTATADSSTSQLIAFTLTKGATTTMLQLSAPSTTYGTGATGTVTVEGADSGSVTVAYGDTEKELTLDESGVATFALPADLAVGSYTVTAAYAGTDELAAGEPATATYEVTKIPTSTSVQLSASSTKYGTGATGTVTVSGADAGTVTVAYDGTSTEVALSDAGVATFALPADLAVGSHPVTATYSGTATLAAGSPVSATYSVTKASTKTTATAPKSVVSGKKVTVKVTVKGVAGVAKPGGKVKVAYGSHQLTGTLSGAGTVSVPVKLTGKGATKIKVTYGGDSKYLTSTDTVTVKVVKK